ncbi:MAG: hypothetical protein ETSY1_37715 [Candidatus Entotheonella factor]|uniref:ABC transporter substrate-binding protein n=1 Tax=Entotheonella factor TaxID=1429438 RepID=W4L6V5_ENTF1|nr:extracellular solute-binding protein [Candidatus Entotheonella palauensis]ETW93783.1 MAG: hypothetical protein ETSY1_37715 [Candidatus Entotheonella factor]
MQHDHSSRGVPVRAGQETTRRTFLRNTLQTGMGLGVTLTIVNGRVQAQETKKKLGSKPITLNVWHTEPNPKSQKAFDQIASDFNKEYPNITVKQQGMGWGEHEGQLLASLAAGSPPDISHAIQYVTPSLAAKGLLEPVDDVIHAIGKDDIFPHIRDVGAWQGDHWYGITHGWGAEILLYRRDWAEKKGLQEPRTWADYYDWLKAMNEPPGHYGLALTGTPGFFVNEDVYMFTGENGGGIWKEGGRPNLSNDHVYGALEHYKKLTEFMSPGWLGHKYVDNLAAIASGKVACTPTWGRTVGYIEKYSPDIADPEHFKPMDFKPVGPMNPGPAETHMFTQNDGEQWVVYKQGKNKEAAIEFLKFFFRNENYVKWCDSVPIHILPIKKSLFNSDEYLNHPERQKWKFWLETQRKLLENKRVMPLIMNREPDSRIPWLMEVANSGILPDMVFDVIDKGKTPQEATQKAEARINKLIDQVKPTIKKG